MTEQVVGAPVDDLVREQQAEIDRLTRLVESSGRLLATLDLDEVLPQVLELARGALAADAYALWNRDPATGDWDLQAASGLSERYVEEARAAVRSNTATISLEGPIVVADIARTDWLTSEHRAAHAAEGNRAFVAMPLHHGLEVIGTLVFYFRDARSPADAELRSVTAVANLAAAAIGTVGLYRQQSRLATNLRFLAEVGTELASSLDYGATLSKVAHLVVGEFADWCIVDVVEGAAIRRVAVAAADADQQEALHELQRLYPPTWDSPQPAARALRDGGPAIFESLDRETLAQTVFDERHLRIIELLEPHSAVAVPLIARGETLGAITLAWSRSGRSYSVRDLPLLEDLAGRIALAVDNARLYQAERSSGERLALLAEAGSTLATSLDYETTLENVARLVVPQFADWCTVDAVDEDGGIRRLAVVHRDPALDELCRRMREEYVPSAGEAEGTGRVIRTGRSALYRRIEDDLLRDTAPTPENLEMLRGLGMASAMVVPLTARGRTLGSLMLVSSDPERLYTEDDLDFAEHVGRRAAIAVDNALLYLRSRELVALLDTLLVSVPVGFAFFDTELRFQRINDALAEINGLPVEEHIGRRIDEVLPGLGLTLAESLGRVLETGESVSTEVVGETRARPAVRRIWDVTHYPIRTQEGEVLGLGVVVHDVTDRRRSENALRFLAEAGRLLSPSVDPTEMLTALAELVVDGLGEWCTVHLYDEGGELRRVVSAHADPARAAVGDELERRWPPRAEDAYGPLAVARTGEPQLVSELADEHLRAVTKDEEHLELLRGLGMRSYMGAPLRARERTLGAISVATSEGGGRYGHDDLELLVGLAGRAALAVDNALLFRELEQRAQSALALAFVGDGVFLVDEEGVVRLWNTAASVITGLVAGDVVGRPAHDAVPGWAAISGRVPLASGPGVPVAETVPVEVHRAERWLQFSGTSFPGGTVYAFRDLTDERRVERLKSEFVSTISHELRTPLAAIYGAALTLRRDEPALEAQREGLLDVIAVESERLARIVNDILWVSRLESGTLHIAVESCEASALVETVVGAARTHLPASIDLVLDVEEDVPAVEADPDKVRQVLTNLVDNAIKYSPDGGVVRVSVERRGGTVAFSVADQGLGIPVGEQERIFDKFYRLDPELVRGIGGTGLGLYITRGLVRRMGGSIAVVSREGVGSTFTVELPVAHH